MSENIASSAVATPAIPADDYITGLETLCGQPIAQAIETIHHLGMKTQEGEKNIIDGHNTLARVDAILLDWICQSEVVDGKTVKMKDENKKYIPIDYKSFMGVRQVFVGGVFDNHAESPEAASKVWERTITRCINVGFVRPVSQDPEALRKAAARKAKAEKMSAISDADLQAKKAELFEDGSSKAIAEMKEIAKEIERRSKDANASKLESYKVMAEAIGKRAKELAKLGTSEAEDMLIRAGQALNVKFGK